MPPVYPKDMTIPINLERLYDKQVYSITVKTNLSWPHIDLPLVQMESIRITGLMVGAFIPTFSQKAMGLFVYDQYKLADETMLYGALRYDYSHIQTSPYQDWFESQLEDNQSGRIVRASALSRRFNSLVWSIGAAHQFGDLETKINVGKSFRAPLHRSSAPMVSTITTSVMKEAINHCLPNNPTSWIYP
jgi:iron complex outermembrane receptor protein